MRCFRGVGRLAATVTIGLFLVYGSAAVAEGGFFDSLKDVAGGILTESAPSGGAALGEADIASGLREALRVGTERVVGQLGQADGFNGDPAVHIPLPGALQNVQSALRAVGMAGLADDLETRMNRAAEAAIPEAKAVFLTAIEEMTLDDVRAIYQGPDDAATQYFKEKMSPPLAERMSPIVESSLADAGAVQSYDSMMGQYQTLPFVPDAKADLTGYVVQKGLDGAFYYLAIEEAKIRQDPAARTTELLQRVFSGN